jgi:phosphoribosylamine--glycine ligase
MRALIIGSGGREHALAWRLSADPDVREVVCAPGNPGIAAAARLAPVQPTALDALVELVRAQRVDLTVVGPELPLACGIADRFAHEGLPIVGPTRAAAQLETSKVFAKAFMARHGIPTARYRACTTPAEARAAVDDLGIPVVVKADGLAAGKGVVVATDRATAEAAIEAAMVGGQFGEAGRAVVVEECMTGEEASFFVLCDGVRGVPLGSAQDHKRVDDDDRGPNTGGMGAFAPSPRITTSMQARVLTEIVEPVLAGMSHEGRPFRGFLYVGLMLTPEGPKVVEFNVRFGDPEAQVVLPALDGPLARWLGDAAAGALPAAEPPTIRQPHVGVVLASGGYPGTFERDKPISGLERAQAMRDVLVFHAGTAMREGRLVTAGGRVLTIVGRGPDFASAIERAYAAASAVHFEGVHLRRDIGRRALDTRPTTAMGTS